MNHSNIGELRDEFLKENYSNFNVHDHLKTHTVEELKALTLQHEFPFWVLCLNILGDLNFSTVVRSAHLLGAERVVAYGRRKIDTRGMVGAGNYTRVDRVMGIDDNLEINPNDFKQFCKENQVVPVFIEQGGSCAFDLDWEETINDILGTDRKPMLVLGTEREGIPENILGLCGELGGITVSIPQKGVIRSHNLSMAFAIVAGQMVKEMKWY